VWTQAFRDVTGLSFAPDGDTFAFAVRGERRVFVYEAATRTLRKTMAVRAQPAEVVFSPDGTRLPSPTGAAPWRFMILRRVRKSHC
jgi:hypothetical protein